MTEQRPVAPPHAATAVQLAELAMAVFVVAVAAVAELWPTDRANATAPRGDTDTGEVLAVDGGYLAQ